MVRKKRASKEDKPKSNKEKRARIDSSDNGQPIRIQKIRYGKHSKEVPSIPLAPNLADMIDPLSPDEFMSTVLRKNALHDVTCEPGSEEEHAKRLVATPGKEMCDFRPGKYVPRNQFRLYISLASRQ
jgi:hypothetical protein